MILRGHTDIVHDLRFIPESEILLSVSSDKDMRAWRLNDYTCAAIYRYIYINFISVLFNVKLLSFRNFVTVVTIILYGAWTLVYSICM